MIAYLFTSTGLSIIGYVLYIFFVKKKYAASVEKSFLYAVVMSSLLLPFISNQSEYASEIPGESTLAVAFGQPIASHHLQQFCRCETPNYSHRVQYRANALYNVVLANKDWIVLIIWVAVGWVLMRLLTQMTYLIYLVRRSDKEKIWLDDKPVYIIYPEMPLSVGAFQLYHRYVIWQDDIDQLSKAEQKAIIRHELSHLQQYNTLENAILQLLQCFWFFNPVFYLIRPSLELLSEFIADEAGAKSLSDRKEYAHLLIKIKEIQQGFGLVQYLQGGLLAVRIKRLMEGQRRYKKASVLWVFLFLGSLQLGGVFPLQAGVQQTLHHFGTYETIHDKISAEETEAIYCRDCESVCVPDESATAD